MYANVYYNRWKNKIYLSKYVDNKRVIVENDYVPYFYAELAQSNDATSIYGTKLKKIQPKSYESFETILGGYKGTDINTFESDLQIETKYIGDTFDGQELHENIPNLDIHFLDIECEVNGGFITGEEASQPITLISLYSTRLKKTFVFGVDTFGKYDTSKLSDDVIYFESSSEKDMLFKYLTFHEKHYPDIITGWNISNYDIPYIVNRLEKVLGGKCRDIYSPWGKPKWNPIKKEYSIPGISILDYLPMYKQYRFKTREKYTLDFICKVEGIEIGGMQKIEYDCSFKEFYENDWQKFVDYNIQDSLLVTELDKKLGYINLVVYMAYWDGVRFEDLFQQTRSLDGALYKFCKKKNLIMPDKKEHGKSQQYAGAYVFEPVPGLYKWVKGWDIASLYPSAMRMIGISPETKMFVPITGDHFNGQYPMVIRNVKFGNLETLSSYDAVMNFIKTNQLSIAANNVMYDNTCRGIIPSLLDELYASRVAAKSIEKEYAQLAFNETNLIKKKEYEQKAKTSHTKQYATKIHMNSLYGYLGTVYSRFFDLDNAVAITSTGQDITKSNSEFINNSLPGLINKKLKNKSLDLTVYGDTDSIFSGSRIKYSKRKIRIKTKDSTFIYNLDDLVETKTGLVLACELTKDHELV